MLSIIMQLDCSVGPEGWVVLGRVIFVGKYNIHETKDTHLQ